MSEPEYKKKITIELSNDETYLLTLALALVAELNANWSQEYKAIDLAKRLDEKAKETFLHNTWPKNLFQRIRYPIKKITIKKYDVNPKNKPEES